MTNFRKQEILSLDLGFKRNRKLNVYSHNPTLIFKVVLNIEIRVSKFHILFFKEIESTK